MILTHFVDVIFRILHTTDGTTSQKKASVFLCFTPILILSHFHSKPSNHLEGYRRFSSK